MSSALKWVDLQKSVIQGIRIENQLILMKFTTTFVNENNWIVVFMRTSTLVLIDQNALDW